MPNTNPAAAPTPDNVSAAFRAMLTFLRLMLGWPQIVDPDVKSDIRALLRVVEAGETEHRRRAALAPAAAPVDYPPAVIEEAEAANRAAFKTAWQAKEGRDAALRAGAEASAAVLARHVVAVRLAAADTTPAILTSDEKNAAAEDRAWEMLTGRLLAVAAERDALAKRVEALRAAIVSIRDQKQERVHHAWVTSIEALAADDKAAQS